VSRGSRQGRRRSLLVVPILLGLLLALLGATPASASGKKPKPPHDAAPAAVSALIVYDDTSEYAWIAEAYATQIANLSGRFGSHEAVRASAYTPGLIEAHTATIYVGSVYDNPLPAAFLADVQATAKPVIWLFNNIWSLGAWTDAFSAAEGWRITGYADAADPVTTVTYKGRDLQRNLLAGYTMGIAITDPTKASVVATSTTAGGIVRPWAVRSGNLTYIGDLPLSYLGENDRYLVLGDLLFDALAPATAERHRALVRLEDVGPNEDPADLRAVVDYLYRQRIPFSFGVYPRYVDPNGVYNDGVPETIRLKDRPAMVAAIKDAIAKGGVMIMHGWTHQYRNKANPYGGTSGDDFEFYLAHEDPATTEVVYDGPVPEDSGSWATARLDGATQDFRAAGLATPTIFEFPHYAASAADYRAVGTRFATRYERSLYPGGVLRGAVPDYGHVVGQFFPYPVKDVYGSKVLPENLGNYEPEPFNTHPARLPNEIVATAARNLVVRDGFASFFYHPFLGVDGLRTIVEGIRANGYVFVSPTSL
jgi:uncharacterized protein YdaL